MFQQVTTRTRHCRIPILRLLLSFLRMFSKCYARTLHMLKALEKHTFSRRTECNPFTITGRLTVWLEPFKKYATPNMEPTQLQQRFPLGAAKVLLLSRRTGNL